MSGPEPPVGPGAGADFRRLMSRWPTGVSVVTTRREGRDFGLTVNAFLSVALAPPTVLISLTHDADTTPELEASGLFAVNVLAHDQRAISERFALALPPAEKFAGLAVARGATGAPLLPDTLAAFEARVTRRIDVADHRLFVGEVVRLHTGRAVAPLLYFRSHYAESDGMLSLTLAAPGAPKG